MTVILFLYANDILIIGSNDKMIKLIKNALNSRFDMKDIRYTDVILRVKILRISNRFILSQSHHVHRILKKFSKDNFSVAKKSLDINPHLSKDK